ncbi:hypothetical protein Emed_003735 [Eimeria media]
MNEQTMVKVERSNEDNGKDEDDVSPPSTPELLDLCFEIEKQLNSEEIHPEAPRDSPLMVQEVLDELEGSETSSPGISSKDALQANLEKGYEGAYPSGKEAEKVSIPSSSVSSALVDSEEALPLPDAGFLDAYGSPSFDFHSISFENQPSPGDAYTETLRASPLMVQEFFEELEGEAETRSGVGPADPLASHVQNLQPLTLGLSVKRPGPDDDEDDDEVAGPSSKVAKTDTTPSPQWSVSSSETKKSSPSSAADSTESGGSSVASSSLESEEFVDFLNLMIPELEPSDELPVPSSVSADASPSSTEGPGPSSVPSGADTTVHPWVRVPPLKPGVKPMQFRAHRIPTVVPRPSNVPSLTRMRELLLRSALGQQEADSLVLQAELLANHAFYHLTGPLSPTRIVDNVVALGRRLMTFRTLYLASRAVQQPWPLQQWWRDLANAIPTECPFMPGDPGMNGRSEDSAALAVRLSAALELYKNGNAPSDDELIFLMRQLFCSKRAPRELRRKTWDPWRKDDDVSPSSP